MIGVIGKILTSFIAEGSVRDRSHDEKNTGVMKKTGGKEGYL